MSKFSIVYPDENIMAFDNDILTRWATKSPQKPGAYFLVDLGEKYNGMGERSSCILYGKQQIQALL